MIPGFGPWEMMIVLIVAVLLFGKRLPEVAKSLGKGVGEFRNGMRGIQDEITRVDHSPPPSSSYERAARDDDRDEPTAPRFEPPPSEPIASDKTAKSESPVS